MMPSPAPAPRSPRITRLRPAADVRSTMNVELQKGMAREPRAIPSKYFYDERGSQLFDAITRLPEYYPTRTEAMILEREGARIARAAPAVELVELGGGLSRKSVLLIEALRCSLRRYVSLDVSEEALVDAGLRLEERFPGLEFEGVVGELERDLPRLPRRSRRLVAFLGSTIGNFDGEERRSFFAMVRSALHRDDALLLGVDLVKERATLEAAYDDAAGVTAEFNRNVLEVFNRELGTDFPVTRFDHVARYVKEKSRIEMALRAREELTVRLPGKEEPVRFAAGQEVRTEISCKFTRGGLEVELETAGLELSHWLTDERHLFGLALIRPR